MSIDLTPPPTAPASPEQQPPRQPTRSSAQIVSIIAMSVGGLLLLGTLVSGVGSIAWAATDRGEGGRTADAAGVTGLSLDVSAGHLVVEYADVDEAILTVDGNRDWTLERRGETLSLSNSRPWWALQVGFDPTENRATLTLPAAMADEKLAADFDVAAGSITADGTYGRLDVSVGAGDATVTGTADDVSVDVSAGDADVTIDGAQRANLTIGAGQITADLRGDSLDAVRVDVSAGTLLASLPDEAYRVTSDVSVGTFDNRLQTSTSAGRTIDAQVSAGTATLRPGE
ncbi:hypothetical protein SAMN05216488_0112 [Microbacterium sp. LKL04]|uniref:hypothetical protein n=1 Tax=Microbacterium sp. LKL04 TaxID=912630 RepID=UPI000875F067|nr:hypothetical protein [Microbacterium sp. LKL04]SCX95655.1 hypothetical protein SAMN05216488_0112 [Microbacterium sp. LKL04]